MNRFLSYGLCVLFLAAPTTLKADITFDVNLSGVTDGVPGFADPSTVTVTGTITVDPNQPVDASNFLSDLTFTREAFLAEDFEAALTEIQFIGDTASNLDFEVVDDELFIRRIGTGDSQLFISSVDPNFFNEGSLSFGSGQFVSEIGFLEAGGGVGFIDTLVLREAGGIDTDNGISLNTAAVPEPTAVGLLALVGLAMMGQRRSRQKRGLL